MSQTSEDDGRLGLLPDDVRADLVDHFGFLRQMLLDDVPRGESLVGMASDEGRRLKLEADVQTPKAIFKVTPEVARRRPPERQVSTVRAVFRAAGT